jgi:hypothetical protein
VKVWAVGAVMCGLCMNAALRRSRQGPACTAHNLRTKGWPASQLAELLNCLPAYLIILLTLLILLTCLPAYLLILLLAACCGPASAQLAAARGRAAPSRALGSSAAATVDAAGLTWRLWRASCPTWLAPPCCAPSACARHVPEES